MRVGNLRLIFLATENPTLGYTQKISAMLESLMTTLSPQSAVIIAITSPAFITATVKNSLVIAVSPLADRLHSDTMGIMA